MGIQIQISWFLKTDVLIYWFILANSVKLVLSWISTRIPFNILTLENHNNFLHDCLLISFIENYSTYLSCSWRPDRAVRWWPVWQPLHREPRSPGTTTRNGTVSPPPDQTLELNLQRTSHSCVILRNHSFSVSPNDFPKHSHTAFQLWWLYFKMSHIICI